MSPTFLTLCSIFGLIQGHMKFVFPEPRSESSGIKNGPCGNDDFSVGVQTQLEPNSVVTVVITEFIHHVGAPYRIALSHVMNDTYEDCILLDHIPQHTYTRSANALYINITIPDVDCPLCALQALSVMTDKIANGECCNYLPDGVSGSCFSNYHSCANVIIKGTQNRDDLQCQQPNEWPYIDFSKDMYTQESSTMYWTQISAVPLDLELIIDGDGNYEPDPCPTSGSRVYNTTYMKKRHFV